MMKLIIASLVFMMGTCVYGASPEEVRVAMALAKAKVIAKAASAQQTGNTGLICSGPGCSRTQRDMTRYYEVRNSACNANTPLVVWVGVQDVAKASELKEFMHILVQSFPDAVSGSVVIGKPYGDNQMERIDISDASVKTIRDSLKDKTVVVSGCSNGSCGVTYSECSGGNCGGVSYSGGCSSCGR